MNRNVLAFTLLLFLLPPQSLTLQEEEVDKAPVKDNLVVSFVKKMLESISDEMKKGNLTVGIEVLDLGEEVGRLTDVKGSVSGEMKKKVEGIKSWGLKLDVEVERVGVCGKYDFVHVDVPMLFPFFGKGDFRVVFETVALGMNMEGAYDAWEEKFDIKLPRLEMSVGKAKVQFDNLMNDPYISDFLNELISNLVPDLIAMLTPPVFTELKPLIATYANGILLCFKNILISNKVQECIENLFRPTAQIQEKVIQTVRKTLTDKLNNSTASSSKWPLSPTPHPCPGRTHKPTFPGPLSPSSSS